MVRLRRACQRNYSYRVVFASSPNIRTGRRNIAVPTPNSVGDALMNGFAGVARQLATTAIDEACDRGGDVGDAQDALAAEDELRASGAFKDAINKYKDAVAKAEGA